MTLTYPHTGNDNFDDALINLIDGVPKYELAYKIVGLVEAKRHYKAVSEEFTKQLNRLKAKAEAHIDAIGATWTPEKWAYKVVNLLVNRTNETLAANQRHQAAVAAAVQRAADLDTFEFAYTEAMTSNQFDSGQFANDDCYAIGQLAGTLVKENGLTVDLESLKETVNTWLEEDFPSGSQLHIAKLLVGLEQPPAEVDTDTEEESFDYEWDDYDYTNYYAYADYYASYKEALAVS